MQSTDPIGAALASALRPVVTDAVAEALAELHPATAPAEILTRKQAAALLQVSTHQLDRLAEAGKVRRHYVMESPRYCRSELLEDVRSGRAGR
jgi:hypothetical protein